MAANIVVISKNSAETLTNTTNSKINLTEPSIVQLGVNRADVAQMDRLNNSLVITLKNGEVITIDGFFDGTNANANSLVLRDADGSFWLADINAQNGAFVLNDYLPLESIHPLLESHGVNSGAFAWLFGAIGVGGLVALFNNDDSGSNGNFIENTGGGTVIPPDTTAPNAPSNLNINDRGTTVTGRTEPGAIVTVKTENGTELGRATADGSGNFSVSINPAQTNGQVVKVTATDAAGNASVPVNVTAPDSTAPASPEGVTVNDTGTVVTGRAEAGSVVSIKTADGTEIGRATVGSDGKFSINLNPAQANGEQLTITATDAANNASPPVNAIAPDITPPAIPTGLAIDPAGTTITGQAEAGSTVIARDGNGTEIGRATADGSGNFTITLQNPEIDGERITVTATDAKNNQSGSASITAPVVNDANLVDNITIVTDINGDGVINSAEIGADGVVTVLVGLGVNAQAGNVVTVNGRDYSVNAADIDNGYIVAQVDGSVEGVLAITVTATDGNGNTDSLSSSIIIDTVADSLLGAITVVSDLNGDGILNATEIGTDGIIDVQVGLTAAAIAGTIVTVNGTDYTVTADDVANGSIGATVNVSAQGNLNITATVTDANGNVDTASTTVLVDTTARAIVGDITVVADTNADGVLNATEIGADGTVTVQVALGAQAIAGDVVNVNGTNYTVTANDLTAGFLTAEVAATTQGSLTITASATDAQGNIDTSISSINVDTTPQLLLGNISVLADTNADGILNAAEIGADGTVAVQVGLGIEAVEGIVINVNGMDYSVNATDIANGFITAEVAATTQGPLAVNVSAADAQGNIATASTTVTVDTIPRVIVGEISVLSDANADGFINAGELGANATLAVRVELGAEAAVGDVINVNGTDFTVTADDLAAGSIVAQVSVLGEGSLAITATATDAQGNSNTNSINVIVDTTPQVLLGNISLLADTNADGILNAAEIGVDGTVDVQVGLGVEATEGTVITVNGSNYTVAAADLAAGFITASVAATTQGPLAINVSATDAQGNVATGSALFTVDTTPQVILDGISVLADVNADGILNATEIGVDGLVDVRVTLGNDALEGTVITVNGTDYIVAAGDLAAGFITASVAVTAEGVLSINATATDAEGNIDTANVSLTVDTVADDLVGNITVLSDLNLDGLINANELGLDNLIDIQVALGADALTGSVISVNGQDYTVNDADVANGYIVAQVAPNAQGALSISVAAVDSNGNVDNSLATVTLDTVAPQVPALALLNFTDSGLLGDNITNVNSFDLGLSAAVEAGATVNYQVSTDGGTTWFDTGTAQAGLLDGNYQFRAQVTDVAGNVATGAAVSVGIDTVMPGIPSVQLFSADNTVLFGNAELGSTVEVRDAGTNELLATSSVNQAGEFVAINAAGFTGRNLRLFAIDAAGNTVTTALADPVGGNNGLITVVQNAVANLSDASVIGPVSTLVNNLADPQTGTLSGLTGIVEQLTATNQPILGAITELVDSLTAANTGGDENLGALINALNAVAGFLGSGDPAAIAAANDNLAILLGAGDGTTVVSDILNTTVAGGQQIVSELLGGSIGINIQAGGLDELVDTAALSGVVNGLTATLTPVLNGLSGLLQLVGINISLASINNALLTAVDNLLSGEQVIQNGVAQATGVLDEVAAGLLDDGALLNELLGVLGLNPAAGGLLGAVVNNLVGSVLTPIVDGVTTLANGTGIIAPPNPGPGNSTTLLAELSTIVNDLTGGDAATLSPISNLLDNVIRNDNLVVGDIINSIDSLTNTDGGALGTLTTLIQQLYNANDLGLSDLTQGLGGLLNGLLDQTVEPLVGNVFAGNTQPLPDTSGNDLLISGLTNEVFVGGEGSDTLIFKVLSDTDNGGNGSDTLRDFHVGNTATDNQADRIDIADLLVDYAGDGSAASLEDYITVTQNGANVVLSIDRDGAGTTYASTDLLTMTNVTVDLNTLLANQQILI